MGSEMDRHPLRLDFGDDSEVRDFIRHTYSIEGMRGAKPPALSAAQLKKVKPLCRKFNDLMANKEIQTWENVTSYIAKHVCLLSGLFCGGTKFAANFLTSMGIRAGHEQIFSHDSKLYIASMVATQFDVEVSGGLPPWQGALKRVEGKKPINHLTIVRHPVDLINSRYYFQKPLLPDGEPTPLRSRDTLELQRDVLTQFELNIGTIPQYIWRIEDEEDQLVVLEIFGKTSYTDGQLWQARQSDRNSKKKGPPVCTWDSLIEPLKDWATNLGYDEDGLK